MCATLLGGFWWVFPVVGLLMCLGFMVFAFRSGASGRGCTCMGGHGRTAKDQGGQAGSAISTEASR